jgi:hypothetical protein
MRHTVELLVNGNRTVSAYYQAAVERWKEI